MRLNAYLCHVIAPSIIRIVTSHIIFISSRTTPKMLAYIYFNLISIFRSSLKLLINEHWFLVNPYNISCFLIELQDMSNKIHRLLMGKTNKEIVHYNICLYFPKTLHHQSNSAVIIIWNFKFWMKSIHI